MLSLKDGYCTLRRVSNTSQALKKWGYWKTCRKIRCASTIQQLAHKVVLLLC